MRLLFLSRRKNMGLMLIMISGEVMYTRDPAIMPINWFVSFSGLTRISIYSNSHSLPEWLCAYSTWPSIGWREHTHTQEHTHTCTGSGRCTLWMHTVKKLWLTRLRFSVSAFSRKTDWKFTEWLAGPSERKYNHILIADGVCSQDTVIRPLRVKTHTCSDMYPHKHKQTYVRLIFVAFQICGCVGACHDKYIFLWRMLKKTFWRIARVCVCRVC